MVARATSGCEHNQNGQTQPETHRLLKRSAGTKRFTSADSRRLALGQSDVDSGFRRSSVRGRRTACAVLELRPPVSHHDICWVRGARDASPSTSSRFQEDREPSFPGPEGTVLRVPCQAATGRLAYPHPPRLVARREGLKPINSAVSRQISGSVPALSRRDSNAIPAI
jgi:hypothetical protein